jgi:O-methyltransferase involved in polyketide biosynthesis
MSESPEAPPGIEVDKPAAARIYDWYLGGTHNWAVDREFGKRIVKLFPLMRHLALQNREFLGRAVRAALDAGVRQFLDLGSGLPTMGNVHEIVRDRLPEGERAAVVYVDNDPVAAAHTTLLLERQEVTDWVGFAGADLRQPMDVVESPVVRRLLNFREPVCLLMVAVLHFMRDADQPGDLVAAYRRRLAPGSLLAISHTTVPTDTDDEVTETAGRIVTAYQDTSLALRLRERAEIEPWFGGWPLVEPGLVHPPDWRPERELDPYERRARRYNWAGVARRPL